MTNFFSDSCCSPLLLLLFVVLRRRCRHPPLQRRGGELGGLLLAAPPEVQRLAAPPEVQSCRLKPPPTYLHFVISTAAFVASAFILSRRIPPFFVIRHRRTVSLCYLQFQSILLLPPPPPAPPRRQQGLHFGDAHVCDGARVPVQLECHLAHMLDAHSVNPPSPSSLSPPPSLSSALSTLPLCNRRP